MIKIIDNKIYDTDEADKVAELYRYVGVLRNNFITGIRETVQIQRKCILYRTPKGTWFEHRTPIENVKGMEDEIVPVLEDDVKDTFAELGDVENYEKYFDRLEQA